MPVKTFQIDLTGNNSRQFNQHVVYQKFLQQVKKGENQSIIRENLVCNYSPFYLPFLSLVCHSNLARVLTTRLTGE